MSIEVLEVRVSRWLSVSLIVLAIAMMIANQSIVITSGILELVGFISSLVTGIIAVAMAYGGRDIFRKYIVYGLGLRYWHAYHYGLALPLDVICSRSSKELCLLCYLIDYFKNFEEDDCFKLPIIVCDTLGPRFTAALGLAEDWYLVDSQDGLFHWKVLPPGCVPSSRYRFFALCDEIFRLMGIYSPHYHKAGGKRWEPKPGAKLTI